MSLDPRLHDYQRRAVEHLRTGGRGSGLFLDMGLGKTAVTLQALQPDHLPVLVLAPKRVATSVWPQEVRKWRPDLSIREAIGTPKQRANALSQARADVTVMTRDTISDLKKSHGFSTIVLDELSGYKTKSTERWKATRRVVTQGDRVWGLTGTPAPNGYIDLWAQVFLLDGGARLGKTLTSYRDRYFTPGRRLPVVNIITEWIPKPGAIDRINELLEDLCLSMSADEYLTLPEISFNEVEVPLPGGTRKTIKELEDKLVADLQLLGLGKSIHTAGNAASLSMRLRQAGAGFLYEDRDPTRWSRLHDEKTQAVETIVNETGSPVLVFYQFRAEREALLKRLPQAKTIDKVDVIERWNRGEVPVLLAHPESAGHGLNLQHGGHTIVWSSLPWSLEVWLQANKRLHRQQQQNHVVVHVLLAPGTPDRSIYEALAKKQKVQDALLDYLTEDRRLLR